MDYANALAEGKNAVEAAKGTEVEGEVRADHEKKIKNAEKNVEESAREVEKKLLELNKLKEKLKNKKNTDTLSEQEVEGAKDEAQDEAEREKNENENKDKENEKDNDEKDEDSKSKKLMKFLRMVGKALKYLGFLFILESAFSSCDYSPVDFDTCTISGENSVEVQKELATEYIKVQHTGTILTPVQRLKNFFGADEKPSIDCECNDTTIEHKTNEPTELESKSNQHEQGPPRCPGEKSKSIVCVPESQLINPEYKPHEGFPMCVNDKSMESGCGGFWQKKECGIDCLLDKGSNILCNGMNVMSQLAGAGNVCPSPYNPWDWIKRILIICLIIFIVYVIVKLTIKHLNKKE